MKLLYPGTVDFDATGRMTWPEYDMTQSQFEDAQQKIDSDFEDAKQETAEEILEDFEGYFANIGFDFDIENYVVQDEVVAVNVLLPTGDIAQKHLLLYDLKIPEFKKQSKIWRWHSEVGKNTCDECASRDGEIFWDTVDIPEIPLHPNCRCRVTEDLIDEDGKIISSKMYRGWVPKMPAHSAPTKSTGPTFEKPINIKPGQYAIFDGKSLTLYQDNKPIISWDAVSGRPGYQSPEYQSEKSTGPIPAGTYVARKEQLQFMNPKGAFVGAAVVLDEKLGGKWPGSIYSWGNSRVWLEPSKETNTFGRNNFSIHGGMWPGSAGCIDMTGQVGQFTYWLESTGNDLLVYVKY